MNKFTFLKIESILDELSTELIYIETEHSLYIKCPFLEIEERVKLRLRMQGYNIVEASFGGDVDAPIACLRVTLYE